MRKVSSKYAGRKFDEMDVTLDKFADVNGLKICYRTVGSPENPALLLIMGLGAQLIGWPDEFVKKLAKRGFFVVTFDNRDCGLSTKSSGTPPDPSDLLLKAVAGEPIVAAYSLSDMADDAVALLTYLGCEEAHIVGASMGGMIAQTIAIEHPKVALSLTSIMSATGNPEEFTPTEEALEALISSPPNSRSEIIEANVVASRALAGPLWEESYAREQAAKSYDRSFHPHGIGFQIGAITLSGDRRKGLAALDLPCLVIHGLVDPLLPLHCGQATTDAIPGSTLLVFDDMGHDLPEKHWDEVINAIGSLT